jgi:hypothetical protein
LKENRFECFPGKNKNIVLILHNFVTGGKFAGNKNTSRKKNYFSQNNFLGTCFKAGNVSKYKKGIQMM